MSNSGRKYLWLIVVIPIIIYGIASGIIEDQELSKYGRYTIGTTISFYLTAKGGRNIWYEYSVGGVKYKGASPYRLDAKVPGGRYYVKFSKINPEVSEIFLDKPVPKHIKEAPESGWGKGK